MTTRRAWLPGRRGPGSHRVPASRTVTKAGRLPATRTADSGHAKTLKYMALAYHVAGTSTSIYDPVANIAAASQYVRDRYQVSLDGSDFAAKVQQADPNRPPHGY